MHNITNYQRNANYNQNEISSINQITSVDKDMEKREPSCTVGVNADWCSHYRKQYDVSSKIKNGTAS